MRNLSLPCGALLALLSLAGCRQTDATDGPTTASGIVLDQVTHQPVPFATVNLLETPRHSGNILTGSAPSQIQQVQADAQGHYSLSFQATSSAFYDLRGSAPGFLEGSLEMQPRVGISPGSKNTVNVPLRPEGYLRVHLLSAAPAPFTAVRIARPNTTSTGITVNAQGSPIDTAIVVVYPASQSQSLIWWLYPAGSSSNKTSHSQNVTCPAHDTADFTIRF